MVASSTQNESTHKLVVTLRVLMVALLGLFVTGVAMTAMGQPTAEHALSSAGVTFWHTLFVMHMLFLFSLTVSALIVLIIALRQPSHLRVRAIAGLVAIACASVSGSLSFQGIHPAITLFLVGMFFLVIGVLYGPLLAGNRIAK